ncbi:MAG: TetR/AcrR family transcriptional regulator [Parasphingorhabdus sp.]
MGSRLEPVRKKPRQKRSEETFDLILETAAGLLEEFGLDKLNTNLICERAGLTPPALYRYFPNKYAILEELGRRLMEAQNQDVFRWFKADGADLLDAQTIQQILRGQYDVTCAQIGGQWITRALHASPKLADIRLQSHDDMVEQLVLAQIQDTPEADKERLERKFRITTETGYAILEMLNDRPNLDVDKVLEETGMMIASVLKDI